MSASEVVIAKLREWKQKWDDVPHPSKIRYLHFAAGVCFFFSIVSLIVYAAGGVEEASVQRTNVVVFMEANPEDFYALRYTLKRSDLFVLAIVIGLNAWNQNLLSQHEATSSFLSQLSREGCVRSSSIPIFYGNHLASRNSLFDDTVRYQTEVPPTATTCSYTRIWPPSVLTATQVMYGLFYGLPPPSTRAEVLYFAEPLASLLGSVAEHSVVAMCLSSLTDFVDHWQRYERLNSKWTQVLVSGGALSVKSSGGDVQSVFPPNSGAEFNFFFDPRAADVVLSTIASKVNVVVVTRDASVDAAFTAASYQQLVVQQAAQNSNATSVLCSAMLLQKRLTISSLGNLAQQDLTAPLDLVTAAVFAHNAVRATASMGSSALSVVHDVSLETDGKVVQSNAAGAPSTTFVVGLDAATFWGHIQVVENIPYPRG